MATTNDANDPLTALLAAYPCGFLLLRDTLATSGAFLLPHLTAGALKQGHKVVLVAAQHSPAKHAAALRKLGVNVYHAPSGATATAATAPSTPQQQQQPQPAATTTTTRPVQAASTRSGLVVPQPRQQQQQVQQQQQSSQQPPSTIDTTPTIRFVSAAGAVAAHSSSSSQQQPLLQVLYQQVEQAARELLLQSSSQQPPQPLTVIVDSLTFLQSLAAGQQQQQEVQALLHQLIALGEVLSLRSSQSCGCYYRLIVLAARDTTSPEHHQHRHLPLAAQHRAHVTADVRPLEGRTAALDGSLSVVVRRRSSAVGVVDVTRGVAPAASPVQKCWWLQPGSSSVWFFRVGDVGGVKWLMNQDVMVVG